MKIWDSGRVTSPEALSRNQGLSFRSFCLKCGSMFQVQLPYTKELRGFYCVGEGLMKDYTAARALVKDRV